VFTRKPEGGEAAFVRVAAFDGAWLEEV